MAHVAFLVSERGLWVVLYAIDVVFLYQIFVRFAPVKQKWYYHVLLLFLLFVATGMIIWVGDNNLLYIMPPFLVVCMLVTYGEPIGRLTVSIIFFCIIMSCNAMIDTFLGWRNLGQLFLDYYEIFTRLCRSAVWVTLWLVIRKHLPQSPPRLPKRIWRVVLGLSLMPLCSMASVILLTYRLYDNIEVKSMALQIAIVVLPFVFITSLILLFAIIILSDHEALEQSNRIANMRELYYEGLQREQRQVRTLRHDLRNHITVVLGLLEQEEQQKAIDYLLQLSDSPALGGSRQICENEAANVVLTSKMEDMARDGLECDLSVSLPKNLLISDIDLCALLGNALDNAMEAAVLTNDHRIILRCRTEKGMFMLRVENALPGDRLPDLSTTKPNKALHGFGLVGMREIAQRYGGSLETRTEFGRFELVVALPLK